MGHLVQVGGGVAQTVQRPEGDDVRVQVETAVLFQKDQPQRVAQVHVRPLRAVEMAAVLKEPPELGAAHVRRQVLTPVGQQLRQKQKQNTEREKAKPRG